MPSPAPSRRPAARRLAVAAVIAVGAVVATLVLPSYGGGLKTAAPDAYKQSYVAAMKTALASSKGQKTIYLPDGSHIHLNDMSLKNGKVVYDAAQKNAISRSGVTTGDPTTPEQRAANRAAAARQRNRLEPTLRHTGLDQPRLAIPQDRYAMYNGCYALKNPATGRWLTGGTTPAFSATRIAGATPLYFKASDLGRYLLYGPKRTYLTHGKPLSYTAVDWTYPGPSTLPDIWTVTRPGADRFTFSSGGQTFTVALHTTTGCAAFPEIGVGVTGLPIAGLTSFQETRGFVDAHTHGMAFEFLGGDVHCGRPWSPYGVQDALRDCPDHYYSQGKGAVLEDFLSGNFQGHDPVGWPTFKDWPAPHSLTHEGTYYKWMERAWRGGQRVLVNLLVENNQLCELYPLKRNSCDDMTSIRLQAKDMHEFERYVDAQHGGPGKGWYRIVTNPLQARQVVNAGKMAVVMGIETSVPFGCGEKLGVPQCSQSQLNAQLNAVRAMGVSQMELVNKFDNALAGVAGDAGSTGQLVNFANFKETGSYWRMQHCDDANTGVHDNDQIAQPGNATLPAQDAIFGAIEKLFGPNAPATPVYPPPHHCNSLGLSDLGKYTIRGMAARHMIFDPDHMSVKARKASLDEIDRLHYPGVVSSHSWSTPDAYPRIYQEQGFITPYAGDSNGFVAKWKQHLGWANNKEYWGFGFGADINGFGAQGDPRPDAAKNHPVIYPFTTLGGVKVYQQHSGQRVYDINKDGVAMYGLYPDWLQDLRMQAGSAITKDMARGPEAYLQMWERAYGIAPNACTNGNRHTFSFFSAIAHGTGWWSVLKKTGQPDRRLGQNFSYCLAGGGHARLTFTKGGSLANVTRF